MIAENRHVESKSESITRYACKAAEQGLWNAVQHCYQQRAEELNKEELTVQEAQRLHTMDANIMQRVRVAQAALAQLLRSTSEIGHAIEQFAVDFDGDFINEVQLDRQV